MCLLSDNASKNHVAQVLTEVLAKKSIFTGYDVAKIAREGADQNLNLKGANVSSYIREVFNTNGNDGFSGYAVAKLDNGPLFYFPVTKGMAASKVMAQVDKTEGGSPAPEVESQKYRVGSEHEYNFRNGRMPGWAMTRTPKGAFFFFKMSPAMTAAKYIEQVRAILNPTPVTEETEPVEQ